MSNIAGSGTIGADSSNVDTVWKTRFTILTFTNFSTWERDMKLIILTYGVPGEEIYHDKRITSVMPVRTLKRRFDHYDEETREVTSVTELWSKNHHANEAWLTKEVEFWTRQEDLRKKQAQALWYALISCLADELLESVRLRTDIWQQILDKMDTFALYRLLRAITSETSQDRSQDLLNKFLGMKWDRNEETLTKFLTRFHTAAENLKIAGKEQGDTDKVRQLSIAFAEVGEAVLTNAMVAVHTNRPGDPGYPKYEVLFRQLTNLEVSCPHVNVVRRSNVKRGRDDGGKEPEDRTRSAKESRRTLEQVLDGLPPGDAKILAVGMMGKMLGRGGMGGAGVGGGGARPGGEPRTRAGGDSRTRTGGDTHTRTGGDTHTRASGDTHTRTGPDDRTRTRPGPDDRSRSRTGPHPDRKGSYHAGTEKRVHFDRNDDPEVGSKRRNCWGCDSDDHHISKCPRADDVECATCGGNHMTKYHKMAEQSRKRRKAWQNLITSDQGVINKFKELCSDGSVDMVKVLSVHPKEQRVRGKRYTKRQVKYSATDAITMANYYTRVVKAPFKRPRGFIKGTRLKRLVNTVRPSAHKHKYVLADSGASMHTEMTTVNCRGRAIKNDGSIRVAVANGSDMRVSHMADLPEGMTIVAPECNTRICSVGQLVSKGFKVKMDLTAFKGMEIDGRPVAIEVTHPLKSDAVYGFLSSSYHFLIPEKNYAGLLHLDLASGVNAIEPPTVDGEMVFTKEQRARAHEVRLLHCARGHPSDRTLTSCLNHGLIPGTHLTARDVTNAHLILGPCLACAEGKGVKESYYDSLAEPASAVGQVLHCDIYFPDKDDEEYLYGGGDVMLLAVDEFSGFLTLVNLKSQHTVDLEDAFNRTIALYLAHHHSIVEVHTDSQSNLKLAKYHLGNNGVKMQFSPPGQHAQRIERYTRTLKTRARCMEKGAVVILTGKLKSSLHKAACYYLNDWPSSKHPLLTPRMLVMGLRATITAKDKLIPFGTVALLACPENTSTKAQQGIVLGPSEDTRHAYECYVLETKRTVVRASSAITVLDVIPNDFPWPLRGRPNKLKGTDRPRSPKKKSSPLPPIPKQIRDIVKATIKPRQMTETHSEPEENPEPEPFTAREGELSDEQGDDDDFNFERVDPDEDDDNAAESTPVPEPETPAMRAAKAEQAERARDKAVHDKLQRIKDQRARKEQKQTQQRKETATAAKARSKELAEAPGLRRSERRRILATWKDTDMRMQVLMAVIYRISVKEALAGEHAQEALEAINDEIQNMLNYRVGHYVRFRDIPKEKRRNILQSFMFLKHKTTPDGRYERTKARMVGNGANQKEHMYNLVSSTTVALASVFVMFNLASYFKCKLSSYDIKGAFLHASFTDDDEVTYIKINKELTKLWIVQDPAAAEFVDERGELMLELDKFIYGLKQSPLKFQEHLINVLTSLGYRKTENDECMFSKHAGKDFSIITLHVDDILQVSTSQALYDELKNGLTDAYGTITAHEKAEAYLGMTIDRSDCLGYLHITQKGMIEKLVEQFPREERDRKVYSTPAHNGIFDAEASDSYTALLTDERSKYLGLIMTLMYLARLSRPDILLPVTYLASRTHISTIRDVMHAYRIIRYLEATAEMGTMIHCTDLSIVLSCDASFNVHRSEGKGHTGFYASFGNGMSYVHGRSGKQKLVSTSSTDAEIIAMTEAVKFGIWLRNLLAELRVVPMSVITILQDNQSAICLVENSKSTNRSRHLVARLSYVREQIRLGAVEVRYKPSLELTADVLTKPLQGESFVKHAGGLLGSRWLNRL